MVGKKSVAGYTRDQLLFNITISDPEKRVNREIFKTAENKLFQVFRCCTDSKELQKDSLTLGKTWRVWKVFAKGLGSNVPSNMPHSTTVNSGKHKENGLQILVKVMCCPREHPLPLSEAEHRAG